MIPMLGIDGAQISETSVTSVEAGSSSSDLTLANSSISSNSQVSLQLEDDSNGADSNDISQGFWLTTDNKLEFHWRNTVYQTGTGPPYAIRLSSGGVLDSNVKVRKIQEETPSQLLQYDEVSDGLGQTMDSTEIPSKDDKDPMKSHVPSPQILHSEQHRHYIYNYDVDLTDSGHSIDLVAVPYDFELSPEIQEQYRLTQHRQPVTSPNQKTVKTVRVSDDDSSKASTASHDSILSKGGTRKRQEKVRVHGIGLPERLDVTMINDKDEDEKILQIVSGVARNDDVDVDVVESEIEEKITYSESEEIVREILLTIIKTFPSPSVIAIRPLNFQPWKQPTVHRYFTPEEVVVHNDPDDLWVSFLGNVYDLTPMSQRYSGRIEMRPLIAFAGKDISHWFDPNGELRHCIHPITGVRVPYLPHGPIPDINPQVPATSWKPISCPCDCKDPTVFVPWWRDTKYRIGKLTEKARPIRIINTLTRDECTLTVCKEDTLSRILQRLALFNSHAGSYTWKYRGRVLMMNKTLDENRIFDEREEYLDLFLPVDTYTPAITLYFNDDFIWDQDTDESDSDH